MAFSAAPALSSPALPTLEVTPGSSPVQETNPPWSISALQGRLCELSAADDGPSLTLASGLALEAQLRGEPVAWISAGVAPPYALDLEAGGLDLEALPCIRVEDGRQAARAADHLLRSGGFGLVITDLAAKARWTLAQQNRLAGLARHHRSALLCLTRNEDRQASSLGSPVSLRVEARLSARSDGRFLCCVEVTKDKQRGPGWRHEEICRGPAGLC